MTSISSCCFSRLRWRDRDGRRPHGHRPVRDLGGGASDAFPATTRSPRPAAATDACRTSASASATNASSSTSNPRSNGPAYRPTPPAPCCCSTTSRCPGLRWGEEFAAAMPEDPTTPGTRRQHRRHPTPRGDPQPRQPRSCPLYRLSRYRPHTTTPPITRHRRPRRPADQDAPSQADGAHHAADQGRRQHHDRRRRYAQPRG